METRSHKRRRTHQQFRDLPPEIFAIVLSFHPDRADPADPVVCALRQLAGDYIAKSSETTEAVTFHEGKRSSYWFPHPVMLSKTVHTKNFVEHSFEDQPAIISHEWRLPLDIGDRNRTPEYDRNDTSIETFHRIRADTSCHDGDVMYVIKLIWKNEGQFIREVETYWNGDPYFTVKEGSNVLKFAISGAGRIYYTLVHSQCCLDGILVSIHSPKVSPVIKWARAAIETYRQK